MLVYRLPRFFASWVYLEGKSEYHLQSSGGRHFLCAVGCSERLFLVFVEVLILVSDPSAVFQVTSGATALFPPGSSLDQQGSILVRHRTHHWLHVVSVVLSVVILCVVLQH